MLKVNSKYLKVCFDFFLIFLIIYISSNIAFHHQNSLYFQTLFDSNFLTYRYPPATYLFPDFIIYYAISLFDLHIWQTINLGGIILFLISLYITILLLGKTNALLVFLIALLITDLVPFRLMYHFGIISLSFLYLIFSDKKFKYIILFTAIISDPLFVVFWLVFPIISGRNYYCKKESSIVIISLIFAIFLNETSIAFILLFFVSFLISVPVIFLKFFKEGILLKEPYKAMIITFGILFLLTVTIYHRQFDRYVVPLIISVLLAMFYNKDTKLIYFEKYTILYIILIFASILFIRFEDIFYGKNSKLFSAYDCAVIEIIRNEIDIIATTDFHTKSLFLSNKTNNSDLAVVQIDAENKILDTWISPYETHLNSSKYFFVEKEFCKFRDQLCVNSNGTKYKFKKVIEICDEFILLNTHSELPVNSFSKIGNNIFSIKLKRFIYNLKINYRKAIGNLKR